VRGEDPFGAPVHGAFPPAGYRLMRAHTFPG
jgi:hypothetical protein